MSSQYFGGKGPTRPHLVRGSGGVAGEVSDLRSDVDEAFEALEGGGLVRADEFVDPPAADADGILTTTATAAEDRTLRAGDLTLATLTGGPRNIQITRGANVGSYQTADDVIVKGKAYGEDVTLTFTHPDADGGDVLDSNEDLGLDEITEITIPADVDAGGDYQIGWGADLVLFRGIRDLAGDSDPLKEVSGGTVVTTGSFSGRKYTPVAAPNGTLDFAVVYIGDPAG